MKNFWVSWWLTDDQGAFELHSPWWISGSRDGGKSICAGIKAETEDEAVEIIYKSYDDRPDDIEFRFVTEKADDWTPYSDRFKKANWMPSW